MTSHAPPENENTTSAEEQRREKRIILRRSVGAVILSLGAFLVWQFGKSPVPEAPPPITPDFYSPLPETPENVLAAIEATPTAPDLTDDAPPADDDGNEAAVDKTPAADNDGNEAAVGNATATPPPSRRLQVGAFSEKDNAAALEQKLNADGLSTMMRESDGIYKIYIVNLKNQAEEEAARRRADFLLAKTENSADTAPSPKTAPVALQVGAFSRRESAEQVVQKLEAEKFKVSVEEIERGGLKLLRVRVVGLQNKAGAEIARKQLVKLGFHDAQIINTQ